MLANKLLEKWYRARDDLGLDIVVPFYLEVDNSVQIRAELLVKNFGAPSGTLIVTDFIEIRPYLKKIQNLGYGFSVTNSASTPSKEIYNREAFIEMLNDWGWSGSASKTPAWIAGSN